MQRGYFTQQLNDAIELHVFPGFEDNYFYLLASLCSQSCVVVDPGNALELIKFIGDSGKTLEAILLTHHHRDHTGGVGDLIDYEPNAAIICSPWQKLPSAWEKREVRRIEPNQTFSILGSEYKSKDIRGYKHNYIQ